MKLNTLILFFYLLLYGAFSGANTMPSDTLKSEAKRSPYHGSTPRHNDLLHTRLDVKFDWNKAQMAGKASITAKPYFKPTSKLDLNARGMEVQSVEVFDLSSGKPQAKMSATNPEILSSKKLNSSYKYENDSIKINLGREFTADEKYLVKISYIAKPNELKKGGSDAISDDRGLYFINPKGEEKNKMPQIWTQGETQASSAWFPTIDSPNEKMTNEIYMTVDSKYTTLSNGILSDSKKNPDGTRTDHWKMDLPHSPYLVMMGVGEFKKVTDAPWNGKEISYYVEKEYEPYAKAIFGNTKEMIEFYSKVLGTPYPWEKYAQIVVRDYVSGAMENTSATLHGDFMVYQDDREMLDGKKGEDVIAHELFHQWFGDLVTAESWSNLSLNESFATYGEYLWEEYKNGRDAADAHSNDSRQGYFQHTKYQERELIRYHYNDREDMFDAVSYNKGGQILHMLRKYTGDKAFFASLKLYLERNRFKNAEVHDLRLAFEEVTGEDLNWFFNQWYLGKGHPELEIQKIYDPEGAFLKLKIRQKQDLRQMPLFVIPVDVDIYSGGKKQRHRILIDKAEQEFKFGVNEKPDLLNFDAERQLLAKKTYTKTTEEYIFQYRNAPLFSDRFEALYNLKDLTENTEIYRVFRNAIEDDKYWVIRSHCFDALKKVAVDKEAELRPLMQKIAVSDKSTKIRARAIAFLGDHYKGKELEDLYVVSLSEPSYSIVATALSSLRKSNPVLALQKAKALESEKNILMVAAVAHVYSKHGNDDNMVYLVNNKDKFKGLYQFNLLFYLEKFLERCVKPESFETAADLFSELAKEKGMMDVTRETYERSILTALKAKIVELKKNESSKETVLTFETLLTRLTDKFKHVGVL